MSDIPRIGSRCKRKKSEDHGVMQNLEASSLAILKTTKNTDDVSGAAKKDGNSIDSDSSPTKKKKRTGKPRKIIKDQPREGPCPRSPPSATTVPILSNFVWQAMGQAVELGQQLQNFALYIVDSQSVSLRPIPDDAWFADSLKADERATQVEWLQRAKAAKASLTAIQEMPSVAPGGRLQCVSEELEPAPSSNMPSVDSMRHFSTGMSIPGNFAVPQYTSAVQGLPADGLRNPQGQPFQGVSHHGPGPYNNQPQYPISRLESTLNRVAASLEANHRLVQQILAQGDQNTNAPR
ncbi:hypothetical protein FACUT_10225 [Fusarium acutatum]|uniref:Uncharacterized protein n=1 Tax=Fusarium acutatum TaxID=78861 RepID=A0A8H4NBV9_9HYPO|nr:hypothetical protein FACUT_10225 [Fusarium acutatum]